MEGTMRFLVGTVGVIIVVLILTLGFFNAHKDKQIARVICEAGVDPVGASMAFTNPYGAEEAIYLLAKRVDHETNN